MITLALLAGLAHAASLPPAPEVPERTPPTPPPARFGSDFAVGYLAGALLGSWPDAGLHGALVARYDVFVVDRDTPGPRLGLSLWGSTVAWPRQTADESGPEDLAIGGSGESFRFGFTHAGIMSVLRFDPDAPVGGLAGLGFGRLDLTDYYGGALSLPVITFEAGARLRATDTGFVDVFLRAHQATSRSPARADVLHEWWMVQLGLTGGMHLR